ncbi:DsbA family oxidoreductase [Brachybacterium fresconis]|uniref:DsbA family dithiol-disulfide isomerase n=1 Tax=Brachybacterium fresconis TaxID=173363 RepID=A0ABS4YM08_9MICO|nr:DsbA family oxidoreductase [Brachybacterium fresconis]MBP2409832.1 putative DsbA family dithiol-disulfide isomerase [Brachybacterium fresconis]
MTDSTRPATSSQSASEPLVTVDVWTDVVCPWCYIGEARLHDAIAAEGLQDQVRVRAHSFELDPTSPTDTVHDNVEHLVTAKGMPEEKVREMEGQIRAMAQELGREYVSDRPMANTRGIHRVMQAISETHGGQAATDFFLGLQRGYFTGGANPFDEATVIAEAVEAGLSEEVARAALAGRTHDDAVEAEVREAAAMGARGVPFFLFNDTYTAPGALPLEAFRQALREIADEARSERAQA